jgi:formylglycine-generating enzyme required for sulfatase activity
MARLLSVLLAGAGLALADNPVETVTNSVGMKFAPIPAGKFTMGSPPAEKARNDDEPQHEVTISHPFHLGIHEVTQGQFAKVMGNNPSFFSAAGKGQERVKGKDTAEYPVDNVTWFDAVAFCERLGDLPAEKAAGRRYRMPSEAEWEYACRAGTTTVFHFGDKLNAWSANFCGLSYAAYGDAGAGPFLRATNTVGHFTANAFGLFDMHGNVQEWCQDWYAADAYNTGEAKDPQGPVKGTERVVRGGAWPHSGKSLRSAVRSKLAPDEKNYRTGFRVVLVAK